MRIAFIINNDRSVNLFMASSNMQKGGDVVLKWDEKGNPYIVAGSKQVWAIHEQGCVMTGIAAILDEMPEEDRKQPLKVLAAIELAKGTEACVDPTGRIRNVSSMKAGESTFAADGIKTILTVDMVNDGDETLELATTALKREAAKRLMDDEVTEETMADLIKWKKAKHPVKIVVDGSKPKHLDRNVVFK